MKRLTNNVKLGFQDSNKLPSYEGLWDRLKYYEELDEGGRMVELPYKLNSFIYKIEGDNTIERKIVDGFEIRRTKQGFELYVLTPIYDDIRQIGYNTVMLDWVFGTREEAEEKLKEWDKFDD